MSLTDAQIGVFAIEMKNTIRAYFAKQHENRKEENRANISERITGNLSDETLCDLLLTIDPDSLDDKSPDGYAELPREDKHRIIERTLSALVEHGFGLEFDQVDNPQWIRVSVAHEGRTPLRQAGDYRWIRLASIDQIIPKVALGASRDVRGWGWNLQVQTNGGDVYYASDLTIRGNLILIPQRDLMYAIDAAIKASIQPGVLPTLA